jgi:hypothetical protein
LIVIDKGPREWRRQRDGDGEVDGGLEIVGVKRPSPAKRYPFEDRHFPRVVNMPDIIGESVSSLKLRVRGTQSFGARPSTKVDKTRNN